MLFAAASNGGFGLEQGERMGGTAMEWVIDLARSKIKKSLCLLN